MTATKALVFQALNEGYTVDEIHDLTKIDKWFLYKLLRIQNVKSKLEQFNKSVVVLKFCAMKISALPVVAEMSRHAVVFVIVVEVFNVNPSIAERPQSAIVKFRC